MVGLLNLFIFAFLHLCNLSSILEGKQLIFYHTKILNPEIKKELLRNRRDEEFACEIDKQEIEEWETKLQTRKQQLKELYKKQSGEVPYKAWLFHKKANQLHQEIRKFCKKIKFWKEELEEDQKVLDETCFRLRQF